MEFEQEQEGLAFSSASDEKKRANLCAIMATHRFAQMFLFFAVFACVAGHVVSGGELVGASIEFGVKERPTPTYGGHWKLMEENSGVSSMHMVLTKENKVVYYDATSLGNSKLQLPPGNCRFENKTKSWNCWAHAAEYDLSTKKIRPITLETNPWCSSGGMSADGTLVQTGGSFEGNRAVRYLGTCPTCNFREYTTALSVGRWYATQAILPDGKFIVVGGRRQYSYEYVPQPGQSNPTNYPLRLLQETNEDKAHNKIENNLYPFVHLSTDGNLFVLANNRSILLNPRTNTIVHEFPILPGGSRSYPASASSALLPIDLRGTHDHDKHIPAEVLICGGALHNAAGLAQNHKTYIPALRSCGRLTITDVHATWRMETMPTPRVMGDMLLLPNAEVLIINGATRGTAGWFMGDGPNFEPLLYRPRLPQEHNRFTSLEPATVARMYHSSSAVLPDGSIMVGGSNPNSRNNYTAKYPTEMRLERFYPPYMSPTSAMHRLHFVNGTVPKVLAHRQNFTIEFETPERALDREEELMVTMYRVPFTTHAFSMDQRLLILKTETPTIEKLGRWKLSVAAPPTREVAPPGYYLLFLVYRGVPSVGSWVRLH